MRVSFAFSLLALSLFAVGCDSETTVVNPPNGPASTVTVPDRVDVDVTPGGGVSVDTAPSAVSGDKPVEVDVRPGGGVDVDVNPGEIREEIRERRAERREAAAEAATP